MKISVAQTRPIKGDIPGNIDKHKNLMDLALAQGAQLVIFPELSITGYEPELAKELATDADDSRFDEFQKIADTRQITIGIGAPIKNSRGISIGMLLFQPRQARQIYAKKYLHADEEPFFVSAESTVGLIGGSARIALAICYELSVPEHARQAFNSGAQVYIASAVKAVDAMERALNRLSEIARNYSMTALMSNCIGQSGGYQCGGRSSVWNNSGLLLAQLNDTDEGIIVIDTDTQEVIAARKE